MVGPFVGGEQKTIWLIMPGLLWAKHKEGRPVMKSAKTLGLALAAVFIIAGIAAAVEQTAVTNPQTTCPVMGGKIDKAQYIDHEGKRVYFCCSMCIDKFRADPARYLKKLQDEGVTLEDIPEGKEPEPESHHGMHGHEGHNH